MTTKSRRPNALRITILVENTVYKAGLKAEHGLSVWIEYGDKKILFDTGQSDLILHNARTLGTDLAQTDVIILSHGHYDHTGGLKEVLNLAENANVYLHPAAMESKYHCKQGHIREIGIPPAARDKLKAVKNRVFYIEEQTEIFPGFSTIGQIPRTNDFEDTGGGFFLDAKCKEPDPLIDDQALFIESPKGLVIILGCAHSGVINTIEHVRKLTSSKKIHAVIGGMHLINAGNDRIEKTIEAIRKYDIEELYSCHCTGPSAVDVLRQSFKTRCLNSSCGTTITVRT